jgi:hypothetical protein
MLYLRLEDREKVKALPGNVDPMDKEQVIHIRFRLPFLDEDDVPIGEYHDPDRGLRLWRRTDPNGYCEDFTDESTISDPGSFQLHHECGLLVNVPCYHGHKLPDMGPCRTFWNGKSWSMELTQLAIRPDDNGELRVLPIVKCRHCGHVWRYKWETVWDFIPRDMQLRLETYSGLKATARVVL